MKPRSWQLWLFGGLVLLLVFVGLLIWAIHQFGWDWTGFNAYSPPTAQYQRGKTLWDWLQLLIVPVILAAGAGFFTWWSARTERQIAQQRYERDQQIAQQRYERDQQIAQQRYERDQQIAQQQYILKTAPKNKKKSPQDNPFLVVFFTHISLVLPPLLQAAGCGGPMIW